MLVPPVPSPTDSVLPLMNVDFSMCASCVAVMQNPWSDDDVRRNKECRLGIANVHAAKVHLDNAGFALRGSVQGR